jgi:hypothetical protein
MHFRPERRRSARPWNAFNSRRVSFVFPAAGGIDRNAEARVMNRIVAVALGLVALLGGYGLASAQEKAAPPPASGKSAPEKAGSQESSTQGKGSTPSTEVLVNGMLTAPGAATDGQAVPSKYSARNAALDKLPIVAFRLRHLTDDQRQEIYEQLRGSPPTLALSPGQARLGTEIPADIALRDLKPTPESVTAKFAELRGTRYLVEGSDVLVVGTNNEVVGVLSGR